MESTRGEEDKIREAVGEQRTCSWQRTLLKRLRSLEVGDSWGHADVSTAFEVCSTHCALKMRNKFAHTKFSVNFAQP